MFVLMLMSFYSRTFFVSDIKAFTDATIAATNHVWSTIRRKLASIENAN